MKIMKTARNRLLRDQKLYKECVIFKFLRWKNYCPMSMLPTSYWWPFLSPTSQKCHHHKAKNWNVIILIRWPYGWSFSTWLASWKKQIFMNSYEQHLTYVLTYKQDMFRLENSRIEHSRSNLFKYCSYHAISIKIRGSRLENSVPVSFRWQ